MLTEKDCNEALDWLYALSVSCKEEVHEHRSSFLGEKYNLIKQLIEEHFDNPPLKFEELKENMWVWDNNWNQYFEICEIYPQTKEFDVLIHQNRINKLRYEPMKFEENRFYRKQVEE